MDYKEAYEGLSRVASDLNSRYSQRIEQLSRYIDTLQSQKDVGRDEYEKLELKYKSLERRLAENEAKLKESQEAAEFYEKESDGHAAMRVQEGERIRKMEAALKVAKEALNKAYDVLWGANEVNACWDIERSLAAIEGKAGK